MVLVHCQPISKPYHYVVMVGKKVWLSYKTQFLVFLCYLVQPWPIHLCVVFFECVDQSLEALAAHMDKKLEGRGSFLQDSWFFFFSRRVLINAFWDRTKQPRKSRTWQQKKKFLKFKYWLKSILTLEQRYSI